MIKIRGSSSAFQWGQLVHTRYASGCHRNILLQSQDVRDGSIDPKHIKRGALNEELYEQYLQQQNIPYVREEPVSEPIHGYDDTFFVGRLDFRVSVGLEKRIDELKSTESSNVLLEIIKKGKYKPENLAQLVSYMIASRAVIGRLIYTYYKVEKNTQVYSKASERTFCVVIQDNGSIEVDNVKTLFHVEDQLNHRQTAAHCINDMVVWARPYKAHDYDGPCKGCVFSGICNKYDAGMTLSTEQFIEDGRQALSKGRNK